MKEDRQDLTTGSIWGKMLLFSIPLVLTNFLQVLFNMADMAAYAVKQSGKNSYKFYDETVSEVLKESPFEERKL